MKQILFAAALLSATTLTAAADGFGGHYVVHGTNIDGTTYGGDAEITLTSDTSCDIKWNTGSTESEGICMRNDDSFAAGYRLGDNIGLVIYKILPDGSLTGVWTLAGKGGNGTEILVPVQ
jgi:hypothetical protein